MNERPIDMNIVLLCNIPQSNLNGFVSLLNELLLLVAPDDIRHIAQVRICEAHAVTQEANDIIEAVTGRRGSYRPSDAYVPEAVVISTELNGGLACFIVISETVVRLVSEDDFHKVEVMSTILEELCHVAVYAAAWRRRGYVQLPTESMNACDFNLRSLIQTACDEYVVARMKLGILSAQYRFKSDVGEQGLGEAVAYGGNVARLLDRAREELATTVCSAADATLSPGDAWLETTRSLYRLILEPLARDAGFCMRSAEARTSLDRAAEASQFYREFLAPYWKRIRVQMERISDSGLIDTEDAIDEILVVVKKLLDAIGISIWPATTGEFRVDFDARFFVKQPEMTTNREIT